MKTGEKRRKHVLKPPRKHDSLEARHVQAEDEIVVIGAAGSAANVVPCYLPS